MTQVHLDIRFRPHQLRAYNERTRFTVRVFHRRAGKTFQAVTELLTDALQTERKDFRGFYLAPSYKQAKAISFDMLKTFTSQLPHTEINESELRVDLFNGARIQLLGAESYDSLRGRYADSVVLDETAQIPSQAWHAVLSPMLADRRGRATFMGTPQGRKNLLHEQWAYAGSGDPEWSRLMLRWQDTNAIHPGEIERMRRAMRPEVFEQELECSWNAAMLGAYYAREMSELEAKNRLTTVPYDKTHPVVAALDLGYSDLMVTGFFQQAGAEVRCIKAKAYQYTSIPDMVQDWRTLGFPIDTVVLPHDAKVHELGTGSTRREVFEQLGCLTTLAPLQGIHEGISAVKDLLPRMIFDAHECSTLIEAMSMYRSEYDDVKQTHRVAPVHDWSSHWADMVRVFATGRPSPQGWGPRPAANLGVYA